MTTVLASDPSVFYLLFLANGFLVVLAPAVIGWRASKRAKEMNSSRAAVISVLSLLVQLMALLYVYFGLDLDLGAILQTLMSLEFWPITIPMFILNLLTLFNLAIVNREREYTSSR